MSEERFEWGRPRGFVWTVEDVARELKVSVRHIYRLTSENKIPFAKIGKLVRFDPTQIENWVRKGGTR